MAARTDLLLDANKDLPIYVSGLMPFGPSDLQHQRDMFAAFPGEWKQSIFNGIGTAQYLKATGSRLMKFRNQAQQQLQNDGYTISSMKSFYDTINKLTLQTATTA